MVRGSVAGARVHCGVAQPESVTHPPHVVVATRMHRYNRTFLDFAHHHGSYHVCASATGLLDQITVSRSARHRRRSAYMALRDAIMTHPTMAEGIVALFRAAPSRS